MKELTPIVWVEATGPITKGPVPWSSVPGFIAPIRYTLADGTTQDSVEKSSRKKDLVATLAKLPGHPEFPEFAVFHEGKYSGTQTMFVLHRPGGVPSQSEQEWLDACAAYSATAVAK